MKIALVSPHFIQVQSLEAVISYGTVKNYHSSMRYLFTPLLQVKKKLISMIIFLTKKYIKYQVQVL